MRRLGLPLLWLLVAACTAGEPTRPSGPGAVSPDALAAQKLDYLRFATRTLVPTDVTNVLAHLERARVDPGFVPAPGSVPIDAWDPLFARMASLADTRDFDAFYLMHVLLGFRDDAMLAPGLADKVERALLGFKYWYTEPTPAGLRDDSFYWSENHALVYHTLELLVGQAYPDVLFDSDARSGAEHVAHARARLVRWLEHRLRFGFSEWHSNVYYQKDLTPLLALVDRAQDAEIRTLAASVLDLLLLDLALHTERAAFGVTHGRSYKKDKMSSLDEDTWGFTRLLFGGTDYPYVADPGATLFALSRRYDVPEAALRIAHAPDVFVDRERMGIHVENDGLPYDDPEVPDGLSFSDPDQVEVWWGMGAFAAWPVVPLTIETLDTYDLWDTPFFEPVIGLRDLAADPGTAQFITARLSALVNFSLLDQVNTYTWRSPEVMLSSAVDYRKGAAAAQMHSWQATFDANAIVFTNHPFRPLATSTDWNDDPETGGYWNGEASVPRSAQDENVAIHIYAPQYRRESDDQFAALRWEPYTHAYFPQDHFDEVVQEGDWVFGRWHDGYVALYSFRPAHFLVYDPAVHATRGMLLPFDLVADGGADNVWIVECGRAADWGDFARFRAAVSAARVEVTPLGETQPDGVSPGFDVSYDSPSRGRMDFGWNAPFLVDGVARPTHDFLRYDNPWARVAPEAAQLEYRIGDYGVWIDAAARTRVLYGP